MASYTTFPEYGTLGACETRLRLDYFLRDFLDACGSDSSLEQWRPALDARIKEMERRIAELQFEADP